MFDPTEWDGPDWCKDCYELAGTLNMADVEWVDGEEEYLCPDCITERQAQYIKEQSRD